MQTASGTAGDRPWAELFAELAFAPEPCELIVETGAQAHKVAFDREAVVWASSPIAADSPLRVALTYRVITPAMMPAVASQVAATPSADPIDVLAAVAQLSPETMLLLRRRMIAVAATRVFGLTAGTYRVTRGLTVAVTEGAAIDVRALVYEGLRTHGTVEQLAAEIAPSGASFVLRPEVDEDVPQFGFAAAALAVVDELRTGASLDALVQGHAELGERGVLAIVNALLAVQALAPLEDALISSNPLPVKRPFAASPDREPPASKQASAASLAARTNMIYELRADADHGADFALDLAEGAEAVEAAPDAAAVAPPRADIEWFESPQDGVESTATQAPLDLDGEDLAMAEREDDRRAIEHPARTTSSPPARTGGSPLGIGSPARAKFPTQSPTTGARAQPTLPDAPKRASGLHPLEQPKRPGRPSTPPFTARALDLDAPDQQPLDLDAPDLQPLDLDAFDPLPARPTPQPALDLGAPPTRARPTAQPALDLTAPPARARPTQHPALDLTAPPARARPTQHPALDLTAPAPQPRARPTQHPALDLDAPDAQPRARPHPALDLSAPDPQPRMRPHPALDPRTPQRATPHPTIDPRRPPDPRTPTRPIPAPTRPTPQPAESRAARTTPPATMPVVAPPTDDAAAHYTRGVALMKVDMEKAVLELRVAARMSGDLDHIAVLAWAQFCLAPNKVFAAKATKAALAKAIYQSQRPEIAHYYLGRMERMLGRDREALEQFQTVISLVPRHTEALAEIRVLEARLNSKKR